MQQFHYYNDIHWLTLLGSIFIILFGLFLPYIIPRREKEISKVLGILMGAIGLFEIGYRISFEGYHWAQVAPFHFCSVSMWTSVLYLWTQRDVFFQISYYFSFGAFLALVLPGIEQYREFWYVVLFMVTHAVVLLSVLFGFRWLGARPTLQGLKIALALTSLLFFISFIWNSLFFTNFMFTKNYLIDEVRFIRPFFLYQILLILSFFGMMFFLYFPFKHKQKSKRI